MLPSSKRVVDNECLSFTRVSQTCKGDIFELIGYMNCSLEIGVPLNLPSLRVFSNVELWRCLLDYDSLVLYFICA